MAKYINMRVPPEFRSWLKQRQLSFSRVHANLSGKPKKISLQKTMRVLANIDGVFCDPIIMRNLLTKEFKIRRRR